MRKPRENNGKSKDGTPSERFEDLSLRRLSLSQVCSAECKSEPAPIHESRLRLGCLLKARRSAGRWWSSDKADWKSVVVTWSGRRLYPLQWMKRLLLKRSIIPRTNMPLSLRTLHRSSLWEISKR